MACVSAYNEENTIADVLVNVIPHVSELVVIDDGSEDSTGLIAENHGALVIHHSHNLGKGAALRHCFDLARKRGSDIVVTLDADGQHDPDDIPSLVIPIQASEADIVIGSRTMNMKALKSMGLVTFASNRLVSWLLSARYGGNFTDVQTGYRAFSKAAIQRILPRLKSTGFEIELEIIYKARLLGLKLKEVPVSIRKRTEGKTKFTFLLRIRSLYFAFKYIMSLRHRD
jgi:glycosyltransferase involved in cell wall biosynthesis